MHPAATAASRRDAFEEEEEEEVLRRASEGTVVYCYVCLRQFTVCHRYFLNGSHVKYDM